MPPDPVLAAGSFNFRGGQIIKLTFIKAMEEQDKTPVLLVYVDVRGGNVPDVKWCQIHGTLQIQRCGLSNVFARSLRALNQR